MRIYPIILSAGSITIPLKMTMWFFRRQSNKPSTIRNYEWEYLKWIHRFYTEEIHKVNIGTCEHNWVKDHFMFTLGYVKPRTWKDRLRNFKYKIFSKLFGKPYRFL